MERAGEGRETEGKSKDTSKLKKREMAAACGSRAVLTPSSISEATMKSLLMGLSPYFTSEVITQPPTQRCFSVASGSGKMLVCKTVYL